MHFNNQACNPIAKLIGVLDITWPRVNKPSLGSTHSALQDRRQSRTVAWQMRSKLVDYLDSELLCSMISPYFIIKPQVNQLLKIDWSGIAE